MRFIHSRSALTTLPHILLSATLASLPIPALQAAPKVPPGHNVHLVQEGKTRFWRGGAPGKDTLQALAQEARARQVPVTLIDLRTPPNKDDRSGKGGRLAPTDERREAEKLGFRYVPVSALDRGLPARLQEAVRKGDVYIHCMYGVNRTGFAVARYASATGLTVGREGLGKRDWAQGTRFQEAQPQH